MAAGGQGYEKGTFRHLSVGHTPRCFPLQQGRAGMQLSRQQGGVVTLPPTVKPSSPCCGAHRQVPPSVSGKAPVRLHLSAGNRGLQGARQIESNDPVLRSGIWPCRPRRGNATDQTGVPPPRTGQCEMKPGQASRVAGLPGVSARIYGCQGANGEQVIGIDCGKHKDWCRVRGRAVTFVERLPSRWSVPVAEQGALAVSRETRPHRPRFPTVRLATAVGSASVHRTGVQLWVILCWCVRARHTVLAKQIRGRRASESLARQQKNAHRQIVEDASPQ